MSYRVFLHSLVSGTLVGEVRPTAARWSRGLNGAGQASITAPTAALLDLLDPLDTRPGSTCITVVDPAGAVEWSGVLWAVDLNLDGDTALNATRLLSVLNRRVVRSTLTYTATDQATIAAGLVNHAQSTAGSRPDRALNISTAGVGSTGVTRDRTYPADEAKSIGEALVQLADCEGGFVFDLVPALGANRALSHSLQVTYPNAGQATTAVLVHRANCLVGKIGYDGTAVTSDVVAFGGGGAARLVERRGGALAGWPCLESTASWNDVTVATTLQQHADRLLALGSGPRVLPAVQVLDTASPVPLNAVPRVVVPEVGLDGLYRVVQVDTTLIGNVAQSSLTLVTAALFT